MSHPDPAPQRALPVTYSFIADREFYRTAFARYRHQRPNRYRTLVITCLPVAALLLAWVYGRSTDAFWTPIPEFTLIGATIGGAVGYVLTKILLLRRAKSLSDRRATVTITLDDSGVHAVEPLARMSLAWAAFTRVARFEDGILLIRGRVIRWLPDSALQNTTSEVALALVRSKTDVLTVSTPRNVS